MTAVAVWDHPPGAAELLSARLADGWSPTPTMLREGAKVLGYAPCAVGGSDTRVSERGVEPGAEAPGRYDASFNR